MICYKKFLLLPLAGSMYLLFSCNSLGTKNNRIAIQEGISWTLGDSDTSVVNIEGYDSLGKAFGTIIRGRPDIGPLDTAQFIAEFYKGGRIECITLYHEGNEVKDRICFSDNGNPASQGRLVGSVKHGKWTYYSNEGKVLESIWYTYGQMIGGMELFSPQGKTLKYCLTQPKSDCLFLVSYDRESEKYSVSGTPLLLVSGKKRETEEKDLFESLLITARSSIVNSQVTLLEKRFYDHLNLISLGEIEQTGRYILRISPEESHEKPLPVILETHYKFSDSTSVDTIELLL